MRFVFDIAIAFLVAVAVGVSSAWLAVDNAPLFGAMRVGPWTAWPHAGGIEADPYDVAAAASSPDLPLGAGEGLAFTAQSDEAGALLEGSCSYQIAGETPPARLWTLTVYDGRGRLMANPVDRFSFHSREIVRRPDGAFAIVMTARVRPGNWLPVAEGTHLTLVLRLYDTPLTSAARPGEVSMPAIRKIACP